MTKSIEQVEQHKEKYLEMIKLNKRDLGTVFMRSMRRQIRSKDGKLIGIHGEKE